MTGRIVLNGNEYLKRADSFEISFTKVDDYLLMMKSLAEELNMSWEGMAKDTWVSELNNYIEKISESVNCFCKLEKSVSDKVMEIYSVYNGIESFMSVFMH